MNFLRQKGILDPDEIIFPITIIGCGGIGSPTAIMLAKVGWSKITLIDHDIVENHNLPNQLFPLSAVGKNKVEACRELIHQFSECSITTIAEKFNKDNCYPGIIVSGVDSMKSRMEIWENIKFNINIPLYIDARIGAELVQVYTVQPSNLSDIEMYEKYLFPDENVAQLPCTAKAIMYTGFAVSSLIGSQLKKWLKQESYSRRISFDLKTMSLLVQD